MINLAWGGYKNGQLPASALVQVTSKPDYLEYSAAKAWFAMRQACYTSTSVWINIAPGSSAYRDLAQQEYFWDQYRNHNGNVAAVPGTSNHGWGRAVDITGYESSAIVWSWLQLHASQYGFSWQTGQASGERWHWESLNAPQNPPSGTSGGGATILEDDMPLTDADISKLLNFPAYTGGPSVSQALKNADAVYAAMFTGGTSMADNGRSVSASLGGIVKVLDRLNAGASQNVSRSASANETQLPADGKTVAITQIQDNADTNTLVRKIAKKLGL